MKPTTVLLSLLLLAGIGGAARAQTTAPKSASAAQPSKPSSQSAKGYCLMKDGNMLLVKNGEMAPMTATLIMGDGSLCMTDGTCQRKNGSTVMLREGQSMLMNGKITRHPNENPNPKMYHLKE